MYPLERIVREAFEADPQSKWQFIRSLGHKNPQKGFQRLYECLRTGRNVHRILDRLPEFIDVERREYDLAREASLELYERDQQLQELQDEKAHLEQAWERERRARRNFKPYLYLLTANKRPRNIFTFVWAGGTPFWLHVKLPEGIKDLSRQDQIKEVGEAIRKHYKDTNGDSDILGPITGYIYRKTYDECMKFTVEGELVSEGMKEINEPRAGIRMK